MTICLRKTLSLVVKTGLETGAVEPFMPAVTGPNAIRAKLPRIEPRADQTGFPVAPAAEPGDDPLAPPRGEGRSAFGGVQAARSSATIRVQPRALGAVSCIG
jgi:hypothetical protein